MKISPPSPEVQYLPAIFRRIQNGDIRIPAFQRRFVWKDSQVLDLLESVYKGFPIGSILFWRVEKPILKVESLGTIFPELPEQYPLSYVLDGVQRLTALYGCFYWKTIDQENTFNVIFDLDEERFFQYESGHSHENYIHLSKIFNPKEFIEAQRYLSNLPHADTLLDKSVKLYSVFQEYMMPTVTITERSVDEVVSIFGRINSTGTRLGTVDFLRAATWSQDFDLNRAIDEISEAAACRGFKIPQETIAKIFAMCAETDPTPESMLVLKQRNPMDLNRAVSRSREVIEKVIDFFKTECFIYSYEFIPYEAQLLVLAKFIILAGDSYSLHIDNMRSWFLSVSFNESYRGKPDSYLIRDLEQLKHFVSSNGPPLTHKLTLDFADFSDRVFMKGRALSTAVASLFAYNSVRSIYTKEPIPVNNIMSKFSPSNYSFIISSKNMPHPTRPRMITDHILANIIAVSADDSKFMKKTPIAAALADLVSANDSLSEEVLNSQMISHQSINLLKTKQYEQFLATRALDIFSRAKELIDNRANIPNNDSNVLTNFRCWKCGRHSGPQLSSICPNCGADNNPQ